MTDYIPNLGDRLYVFGATSMFEYVIKRDNNNNDVLDLDKVWQASHLNEAEKDDFRSSMRTRNEAQGNAPSPQTPIDGRDFTIVEGDRVFIFSVGKMFEYHWNIDESGNELLDLFKSWESSDLSEDIKDKLRENIKRKNNG